MKVQQIEVSYEAKVDVGLAAFNRYEKRLLENSNGSTKPFVNNSKRGFDNRIASCRMVAQLEESDNPSEAIDQLQGIVKEKVKSTLADAIALGAEIEEKSSVQTYETTTVSDVRVEDF